MNGFSNQEAMMNYEREREILFAENIHALEATSNDKASKMEAIFKMGGIKQEAIDSLIFGVRSVEMMTVFLRYGGDIHKIGPPNNPHPLSLLWISTSMLQEYPANSIERRELVKLVKFLIVEGVDLNVVDKDAYTPFAACVAAEEFELYKMLIERGADPSSKRNDGWTALHAATRLSNLSGQLALIRYLVEECGLNIDSEYQDPRSGAPLTPIGIAASNGDSEMCKYFLRRGAKVDTRDNPLLCAARVLFFINFLERSLEGCSVDIGPWSQSPHAGFFWSQCSLYVLSKWPL
jgi:hypothetical protein